MYNARKIVRTGNFKERMHIKVFKTAEEMHKFLNSQDNTWSEYEPGHLKTGVYAIAGGNWHNVRNLDASLLAHI